MSCCNQKDYERLICYCFNITESAFIKSVKNGDDKVITDFVIFQTKNNYCDCNKLNPSKNCCLKDFKFLKGSVLA
jgi:hypothetical protein